MVSTRGVRYKFSEGERVLCYEPDPTKAKVLYDSKVLEVIENKDKRGRRTVEYLIHFQGWNSSWDRCVSEDFVLKDTEENRQLQRDLAEKSQLQLGAYLYRRERKKTGGGPAKRARHGFSDDGSSSSTQPDGHFSNSNEEGEADTDSSDTSGSTPQEPAGPAHIAIPTALRDRLTFDYHLVVKRGRLSRLPASPNAAEILEAFVKWFARAGAWQPARGRQEPPQRPDLLDVARRLNLVREVADGIRVYFDFILAGHLLYKEERAQYEAVCGRFLDESEDELTSELDEEGSMPDESTAVAEEDLKSPKIPEYSHLPPDPTLDGDSNENQYNVPQQSSEEDECNKTQQTHEVSENTSYKSETADEAPNTGGKVQTRPVTRSGGVARRLRSHKSAVSQSENEEPPAPSTSTIGEQKAFETLSSSVGSSGSSMCEGYAGAAPPPAPPRTLLSQLFDKVANFQIIPREGTEHFPCRVYGAIHLARLFVMLPKFLNATQMADSKLKVILKYIDIFLQYFEEHGEWFGEMYYISRSTARSH